MPSRGYRGQVVAEQQAESSHLEAQAGSQNGELEISVVFKCSTPPRDTLPPKATPPKPPQRYHEW